MRLSYDTRQENCLQIEDTTEQLEESI
jgi:hypothetical protein